MVAEINDVAFSPDGALLATGGDDGNAKLWDAASGKLAVASLAHANPVQRVLFSPGGNMLVTIANPEQTGYRGMGSTARPRCGTFHREVSEKCSPTRAKSWAVSSLQAGIALQRPAAMETPACTTSIQGKSEWCCGILARCSA
jgi:hypothetical protein